jgi:hypothetical protein
LRYVLVGILFISSSIVGAKRAIFFLYPLQFLAIYYFIYVKGTAARLPQKVGMLYLLLGLTMVISSSILYFNISLNPEGKIGGNLDVQYAFKYARKYTDNVTYAGFTTGRYSTTKRIFRSLWNSGPLNFLVGFGPGSTTASYFDARGGRQKARSLTERLRIFYGLTSMNRIALEYGVSGALSYFVMLFLFTRMCWRYYVYEADRYWKAFAAGSVGFSFSMLVFYFAYSHGAFLGDTMPCLYFYAMAVVYTRLQKISGQVVRA